MWQLWFLLNDLTNFQRFPWASKVPVFSEVSMYVLRHAFNIQAVRSYTLVCILLIQSLKVGQRQKIWAPSGLLGMRTALYMSMAFSIPRNIAELYKGPCGHLNPQIFLLRFWLGSCLCQVLSLRQLQVKQFCWLFLTNAL